MVIRRGIFWFGLKFVKRLFMPKIAKSFIPQSRYFVLLFMKLYILFQYKPLMLYIVINTFWQTKTKTKFYETLYMSNINYHVWSMVNNESQQTKPERNVGKVLYICLRFSTKQSVLANIGPNFPLPTSLFQREKCFLQFWK